MIDEQQFEHPLSGLECFLTVDVDDLPLRYRRCTARQQLGRLFNFHEAHAANAGHRE